MIEGTPYYRHRKANDGSKPNNHKLGVVGDSETFNKGERYPETVIYFQQKWRRQNQIHPTQKPVELLEYLIKTYTLEEQTVLDNCMGSGSTGVACKNLNRKFIGIELDNTYFEIAKERIENTKGECKMICPLNLTKSSDELKQLIAENPDLPIVVLVGQDAASDDYGYTYCSDIHFCIDEILDCELPFGEGYVYNDRDDLEDALSDYLADCEEYENLSDEEFQTLLIKELSKYEPYWKKVIAITVDN